MTNCTDCLVDVQAAPKDHPWRHMANPQGGGNGMVPHCKWLLSVNVIGSCVLTDIQDLPGSKWITLIFHSLLIN